MVYILLIVGFVCLVKGADFFVSGSSAIAKYFNIPSFIIGLTIVACGTSLPEAAVSVTAALRGANGIAVGNVIGSNMFNLLVVLGASAIIKTCPVPKPTLRFEYPLSIIAAAIVAVMCIGTGNNAFLLSRIDGIILLCIFVFFIVLTVRNVIKFKSELDEDIDIDEGIGISPVKGFLYSVIGIAGIIIGGDVVVDSATEIATSFGIDETLIGLTIVAMGTSLPELVTSIVAAFKGETDIAVGNVIGSNLFNLLFVLGISTTIHPIQTTVFAIYDIMLLVILSLLLFIPLARKRELTRKWGILLVLIYAVYLVYIIMRTI